MTISHSFLKVSEDPPSSLKSSGKDSNTFEDFHLFLKGSDEDPHSFLKSRDEDSNTVLKGRDEDSHSFPSSTYCSGALIDK
jgi:hypothetical protein